MHACACACAYVCVCVCACAMVCAGAGLAEGVGVGRVEGEGGYEILVGAAAAYLRRKMGSERAGEGGRERERKRSKWGEGKEEGK